MGARWPHHEASHGELPVLDEAQQALAHGLVR
jgi:hypothetical protein